MSTEKYYPSFFSSYGNREVTKHLSELNPQAPPFVSRQSKPLLISSPKHINKAHNNLQEFSPTQHFLHPLMKIKFNPFDPEGFADFFLESDQPPLSSPSFSDSRSNPSSFPFDSKNIPKPELRPICTFALKGFCRNGDFCRYAHGILCPTCKTHVLHPDESPEEHQYHIHSCQVASLLDSEDNIECSICLEKVKMTNSGRFGLLSCEHPFCLDCIQSVRLVSGFDSSSQKTCPICMTFSSYIIPSYQWITDKREKDQLAEKITPLSRSTPCKYFNFGIGQCPFGKSCFYDHVYLDGTRQEGNMPKITGS